MSNQPEQLNVDVPQNVEVEQVLIGALFANNKAVHELGFLSPEHFYDPLHGRLYAAIVDLVQEGKQAAPFTLKNRFASDEAMEPLGGTKYLAKLSSAAVGSVDIPGYARLIKDLAVRRDLLEHGRGFVASLVGDHSVSADELADQLQESVHRVREGEKETGGFTHISDAVGEAMEAIERATRGDVGITTGLADLDAIIGGLRDSDLVVVAGRPSMGKTALALHFAKQPGCAFFSLEMPRWQLACRMMSETSYPDFTYQDAMAGRVPGLRPNVSNNDLYINDTGGMSLANIRAEATRLKRQGKLKFVVIDYLQIMKASGKYRGQRVNEIAEITGGLKALAKDINVPVVLLSQLSREVERRENKRPMMSDLRDSGSIEQDADVIIFVYREVYYLERNEPEQGDEWFNWKKKINDLANTCTLIVDKNRNGPTRSCNVFCSIAHAKFGDLRNEP